MQIDEKTEKLLPCYCGGRPDNFSIGYGSTPYYINCPKCRKLVHGGSGVVNHFIEAWNRDYRHREGRSIDVSNSPN